MLELNLLQSFLRRVPRAGLLVHVHRGRLLALARELSLGDRDVALAPQPVELFLFLLRQRVPRGGASLLQRRDALRELTIEPRRIVLESRGARDGGGEGVVKLAVRRLGLVHLRPFDTASLEQLVENLRANGREEEGGAR